MQIGFRVECDQGVAVKQCYLSPDGSCVYNSGIGVWSGHVFSRMCLQTLRELTRTKRGDIFYRGKMTVLAYKLYTFYDFSFQSL